MMHLVCLVHKQTDRFRATIYGFKGEDPGGAFPFIDKEVRTGWGFGPSPEAML